MTQDSINYALDTCRQLCDEIRKSEQAWKERAEIAERLEDRVKELELQIVEFDDMVDDLGNTLIERSRRIAELERRLAKAVKLEAKIAEQAGELELAKIEMHDARERAAQAERLLREIANEGKTWDKDSMADWMVRARKLLGPSRGSLKHDLECEEQRRRDREKT